MGAAAATVGSRGGCSGVRRAGRKGLEGTRGGGRLTPSTATAHCSCLSGAPAWLASVGADMLAPPTVAAPLEPEGSAPQPPTAAAPATSARDKLPAGSLRQTRRLSPPPGEQAGCQSVRLDMFHSLRQRTLRTLQQDIEEQFIVHCTTQSMGIFSRNMSE